MANVQPVIEGWRGVLCECGLGSPVTRAVCAGTIAAGGLYLAGMPRSAFREDGSMRPFPRTMRGAMQHFLFYPVVIGAAVGSLT